MGKQNWDWMKIGTAAGKELHELLADRINNGLWVPHGQKVLRGKLYAYRIHDHLCAIERPVRAEVPYSFVEDLEYGGKIHKCPLRGRVDAIFDDGTLVDWKLFIGKINLERRMRTKGVPQWRRALHAFPDAPAFLYLCFSAKPLFYKGNIVGFDLVQHRFVRMPRKSNNAKRVRKALRRILARNLKA